MSNPIEDYVDILNGPLSPTSVTQIFGVVGCTPELS